MAVVQSIYTVFICQQSYLLLFGIPSPTRSFIPGLKPSFSANPSHCSPSFLLLNQLKYLLRGFPGLYTVISEHVCFLLLVFSLFLHFLVVGSVRQINLTHVGFRAHVKIASRIVSYRSYAREFCSQYVSRQLRLRNVQLAYVVGAKCPARPSC